MLFISITFLYFHTVSEVDSDSDETCPKQDNTPSSLTPIDDHSELLLRNSQISSEVDQMIIQLSRPYFRKEIGILIFRITGLTGRS